MFKEMLGKFELMKKASSSTELEAFSSEVLNTLEKEAFLGALAKGVASTLKPATAGVGRAVSGVGKSLFNSQMTLTKSMVKDPVGATMLAAPVLAGKQNIVEGVAQNTIPLYDQMKQVGRDLKQSKERSRVSAGLFTPTRDLPYVRTASQDTSQGTSQDTLQESSLEKEAYNFSFDSTSIDPVKEVINSVGIAAGAGAGTYLLHDRYSKAKETANWAKGLSMGIDKAVTGVGKGTAKAMTKHKPFSQTVVSMMGTAGKIADKLGDNNSLRLDYSTVDRKVPLINRLPVFLGTVTGVTLLEEWLSDKALQRITGLADKRKEKKEASSEAKDLLEKEALSRDTRRLVSEQMIKPAITTGVSLGTLALLSRLVGHNLYGGMEKIRKDDEIGTKRVIIDVPSEEISGSDENRKKIEKALAKSASISKLADFVQDMHFLHEAGKSNSPTKKKVSPLHLEEKTKMDQVKEKLDKKIQSSKVLSKVDDLMNEEKYRYTGKRGLAHFLVEEAPFRTVNSLSYAAPMVAAGIILDRNLKRGLEPLEDEPGIPSVPPGVTRVVIMERPKSIDNKKGEGIR